jgi:5-hydroxyisourate hydrolase-like protein (transthyretin family)
VRPITLAALFAVCVAALGSDKYNMTKLTVEVLSADTGKPVDRASVIVRFRHGRNVNLKKIVTNWETKTNQQGKVTIPAIPQGEVTIQVIASDFQTFGDVFQLVQESETETIKLKRPQAQYSEDDKRAPQSKPKQP